MRDISLANQQHRQAVGEHIRWLDGKEGSQKSQDRRIQKLADQPGLHSGNVSRQGLAQAGVQLLSMLSSVQGSNATFATSPERIEERQMEDRLLQADAAFRYQRAEQAMRREFNRSNGQDVNEQEQNNRRTAPDRSAEPAGQPADGTEINTKKNTEARMPATTPDAYRRSGISLSSDMLAPAGDPHGTGGPAETKVLSDLSNLPYRAYSGVSDTVAKVGSWLDGIQGPILFAQASPVETAVPTVISPQMNMVVFNETAAQNFLREFIGGDDGKFMADEISKVTAGKELMLMAIPQSGISKRAALSMLEAQENAVYQKYLSDNCRIRTKTVYGRPVGDSLLVAGEYARNPWRGLAEAISQAISPGRQLTANEATATEYFNVGSDLILTYFTAGFYGLLKYGSAKSLSVAGQAVNGDTTCLKREFSPEELARLLFDTEAGIMHHEPMPRLEAKPSELASAGKFEPSGLFVEEHLPSGIQTEKYMSIYKDGADVWIREKAPNEYFTYYPSGTHPEHGEQRVFFDVESKRIYFSEDFVHGQGYDVNIASGRKFIEVQGKQFELHYNRNEQHLEVEVDYGDVTSKVPVYKEKLSHAWHLEVQNNNPVFDEMQKMRIDGMKFSMDAAHVVSQVDNLNPSVYGSGKIYEVRGANAAPSDAADLLVIEMRGELMPVRMKTVEGHGVFYEAYERSALGKRGHPVEWDGRRWIFDKKTSIHVAPELESMAIGSMHDQKISALDLSAPDLRGIRWDKYGRGFLKIKGGFVRINKSVSNPDAASIAHKGVKTNLIFHRNRFHPENVRHRLQRLKEEGMSGRGAAQVPGSLGRAPERSAVEIIQRCFGYSPEQAAEYLRQFHFEPNGLHNEREFALYMESYDAVPHWARPARPAGAPSAAEAQVVPVAGPSGGTRINLGAQIGEGAEGRVYLDAMDNNYVIKELEDRYFSPDDDGNLYDFSINLSVRQTLANRDVMLFNRYYGEGMAETITENNQVYIRMPKIPGKELRLIAKGQMPDDGVERYVDMLERLSDVGIWHGDLHASNVMFDPESKTFYPIDFSNVREHFLNGGQEEKATLNFIGEGEWTFIIAAIRGRMNNPRPRVWPESEPKPGPSRQGEPEPGPSRQARGE